MVKHMFSNVVYNILNEIIWVGTIIHQNVLELVIEFKNVVLICRSDDIVLISPQIRSCLISSLYHNKNYKLYSFIRDKKLYKSVYHN